MTQSRHYLFEENPVQRSSKFMLLGLFWFLLLLMPLFLYLGHIQLFPLIDLKGSTAQFLYWITCTGSIPEGLIFIVAMLAVCYFLMPRKLFIHLFLSVALSQSAGVVLKHELKNHFMEPRPNVQWFDYFHKMDKNFFYGQSKENRQAMMKDVIRLNAKIMPLSDRIAKHWQKEVNFSFPSGHTQFAVSFCLVMGFYLLSAGIVTLPFGLFVWAMVMGFSRMMLGLHWSQDVLASGFMGGILAIISVWLVQKLAPKVMKYFPAIYRNQI